MAESASKFHCGEAAALVDEFPQRLERLTEYDHAQKVSDVGKGEVDGKANRPSDEGGTGREELHYFARRAVHEGEARYRRGMLYLDEAARKASLALARLAEARQLCSRREEDRLGQLQQAQARVEARFGYDSPQYTYARSQLSESTSRRDEIGLALGRPCRVSIPHKWFVGETAWLPVYLLLMTSIALLVAYLTLAGAPFMGGSETGEVSVGPSNWPERVASLTFGASEAILAHLIGRWFVRSTYPKLIVGTIHKRKIGRALLALATAASLAYLAALARELDLFAALGTHRNLGVDQWYWRLETNDGWSMLAVVLIAIGVGIFVSVLAHDPHPYYAWYSQRTEQWQRRIRKLEQQYTSRMERIQERREAVAAESELEREQVDTDLDRATEFVNGMAEMKATLLQRVVSMAEQRISMYEERNREVRTAAVPASFGRANYEYIAQRIGAINNDSDAHHEATPHGRGVGQTSVAEQRSSGEGE